MDDPIRRQTLGRGRRIALRAFRLALFSVVSAALVAGSAARATSQDVATEVLSAGLEGLWNAAADAVEGEETSPEARLAQSALPWLAFTETPDAARPVPGVDVEVDVARDGGMTPAEARGVVFARMADAYYAEGAEGLAGLASEPEMASKISGSSEALSIFAPFTAAGHGRLVSSALLLGGVALVLLAAILFLGRGPQRLGLPGRVLVYASLPGAILTLGAPALLARAMAAGAPGLIPGLSLLGLRVQTDPATVERLAAPLGSTLVPAVEAMAIIPLAALVGGLVFLSGSFALRSRAWARSRSDEGPTRLPHSGV